MGTSLNLAVMLVGINYIYYMICGVLLNVDSFYGAVTYCVKVTNLFLRNSLLKLSTFY